jgi:CRP-like cAMP-binding protein
MLNSLLFYNEGRCFMVIFQDLYPATIKQISAVAQIVSYAANDILYSQGDPPTGLFLVQSGYVILFRQSGEKSQILALVHTGEVFGGESIANNKPCPYTVRAVSRVEVLHIAPDDLQNLLQNYPDFLSLFLNLVTLRLRQLTALVHDLAFRDVSSRLAGVLLMLAQSQDETDKQGMDLVVPRLFSQQELASMVGTAREVVYRVLKQFEQDALIRKDGKTYIILDPKRLEQIAIQENR